MRERSPFYVPTHFYLKGKRWNVEFVDDLGFVIKSNGKKSVTIAECDGGARRIEILERLSAKRTAECFLHEYLHAIEYAYGIRFPHKMVHFADVKLAYIFRKTMECQPRARRPAPKRKRARVPQRRRPWIQHLHRKRA